jgi:hypothetical protein
MRKLALLLVLLPLVAVWVYGCNETTPTETATVATDASVDFRGTRQGLSSTFDNDAGGWTLVGDGNAAHTGFIPWSVQPSYDPTAGNPGGAIYAVDSGKQMTFFWHAPPKFLRNRMDYGWTLEFDIKIEPASPTFSYPDVLLAGSGLSLTVNAGPEPTTTGWTHYSVALAYGGGWTLNGTTVLATEDQIRNVLKDLTVLLIRGEYVSFTGDKGYLDNVEVLPPGLSK